MITTSRSVSQFVISSRRVATVTSYNSTYYCRQSSISSSFKRNLSSSSSKEKPTVIHKKVSPEQRAALRQARKERSIAQSQQAQSQSSSSSSSSSAASSSSSLKTTSSSKPFNPTVVYGLGLAIPTLILAWGVYDHESPPAKFASFLGFDEVFDSFAKPTYDKLLPNWNDVSY